MYQGLPFRPVAGTSGSLRMPAAAGTLRLAAILGALCAFLEARRESQPTAAAPSAFDAAAETLRAGMHPHRLTGRRWSGAHIVHGPTPADVGEGLLAVGGPLHALASAGFGQRERATAKTVGLAAQGACGTRRSAARAARSDQHTPATPAGSACHLSRASCRCGGG